MSVTTESPGFNRGEHVKGWANCGTDSRGRPIGYAWAANCDEPGCFEIIDRGIAYVCGDMHGTDDVSCEGYFCLKHKETVVLNEPDEDELDGRRAVCVCARCAATLRSAGREWDEEAEILMEIELGESGLKLLPPGTPCN